MQNKMAQKLFKNTNVPLGVQVEFFYQWSQWIQNINQSEQSPSNHNIQSNEIQSNKTNVPEVDTSQSRDFVTERKKTSKTNEPNLINLKTILQSNTYGKSLIDAFGSKNIDEISKSKPELTENLRHLLCEAILQYCIEYSHDLTVRDCEKLANQICQVFPDELMVDSSFSFIHLSIFFLLNTLISFIYFIINN